MGEEGGKKRERGHRMRTGKRDNIGGRKRDRKR